MIILIAESKTMAEPEIEVSREEFEAHRPAGEEVADDVMADVAGMDLADVATAVKVSAPMARKILRMAYEFPNKSMGYRAVDAYTGVVFKALGYPTLTADARDCVTRHVRIISSLYGWLRPDDIIKPYRFDFTTRLAPGDRTFYDYWSKDATVSLVREVQESGDTQILNLLPADAAKCIDWKLVKRFAKVWKVDFKTLAVDAEWSAPDADPLAPDTDDWKTILASGDWKTPHAGLLKELRGTLLRAIAIAGITDPEALKTLTTDTLTPLGTPVYPDHLTFTTP